MNKIIILLILLLIPFTYASVGYNEIDYGVHYLIPINYSSTNIHFEGNLTNLSQMDDVHISAPTNNQLFQFLTSDNKWHPYSFVLGDWWDYDYNDLINEPTDLSDFNNDVGFITSASNIFDQNLNTTENVTFANVTALYFIGNGSQLTGIDEGLWEDNGSIVSLKTARDIFLNGSVGIGTTAPTTNLNIFDDASTGTIGIDIKANNGIPIIRLKSDTSIKHGVLAYYDDETFKGGLTLDRTTSLVSGTSRNDIVLYTNSGEENKLHLATNSTVALSIDTSQNVGIGTTAPQNKLNVNGTGNFTGALYSQEQAVCLADGTNCQAVAGLSSAAGWVNTTTTTSTDLDVNVTTGNLTVIGGNVGIGTASPTSELSFGTNASISRGTSDSSDNGFLTLAGGGTGSFFRGGRISVYGNEAGGNMGDVILYGGKGDGTGGDIIFSTFASSSAESEKMRVNSDGKVGIGTTTPLYNLHLGTGISAQTGFYGDGIKIQSNFLARMYFEDTGADSDEKIMALSSQGGNTRFNSLNDEGTSAVVRNILVMEHSTGYVGIGTTTPSQKLEVAGNANITTDLTVGDDVEIGGDLTPQTNATSSIGSSVLRWLKGWFVNLDVENNIIVGGDLNVSGYVNGKNYVTQYHRNAIIDTTSVNIWVNVTWDLTIDEETTSGYSLNDSNTSITIENDGIYRVQGCLHPKNNGVGNQEANLYSRILIDDVEAKCLQFANSKEFKTTGINTMPFIGTIYAEAGQKVQLQYYVTNLDIDFEGDTVFDDAVSASLNFERLSN